MSFEEAKSGLSATSRRPPCPAACTSGTPLTGGDSRPSLPMRRSRPGRSVTSSAPVGQEGEAPGVRQPLGEGLHLEGLLGRPRRSLGLLGRRPDDQSEERDDSGKGSCMHCGCSDLHAPLR